MSAKRYIAMHETEKGYKTIKDVRAYISREGGSANEWRVVELGQEVKCEITFDNLIYSRTKEPLKVNIAELINSRKLYEKGQKWYVKHEGATCLTEVEITDVTSATVQIKHLTAFPQSVTSSPQRYRWVDLEFIEIIKGSESA